MNGPIAVWSNGHLTDTTEAQVDLSDRGLLLGDGLFETLAVFNGVPFRLSDHIDRISEAAVLLGLFIEKHKLTEAVKTVAAKAEGAHGIIRLTVTRGSGGRGLKPPVAPTPSIFAVLMPWSSGLAFVPTKLVTSTIRRNDRSPVSRIKALGYLDNILALQEVAKLGADDALLLNTSGRVCCTTIANIFAFIDGKLITPPLFEGVLPGITRKLILETCKSLGIPAEETSLTREMLTAAEAVFVTNSIRLIRPVTTLDRADISSPGGQELIDHFILHLLDKTFDECGGLPDDLETTRQTLTATLRIADAIGV